MYAYVTDKNFIKESYGICADIVNQLVQKLNNEGMTSRMLVVGSKKRNFITRNGNGPIDYDFNLVIDHANEYQIRQIKPLVMNAFNVVLDRNGWRTCNDSTPVITTKKKILSKKNPTPVSIDLCIVKRDFQGWHRLIHEKTGNVSLDRYYWNLAPKSDNLDKKEKEIKDKNRWNDVRDRYLKKKNMYLRRNDKNHPSFICYIEALNEVYFEKRQFGVLLNGNIQPSFSHWCCSPPSNEKFVCIMNNSSKLKLV